MLRLLAMTLALTAPAPAMPASLSCAKIASPSVVNSLVSGTTFSFAQLKFPKFKQGPTTCDYYDANPPSGDHNPYSGELVISYGPLAPGPLAAAWKKYSNPPRKSAGPFTPAGIGDKAIEWNHYVVWTRGSYFAEVWSNGSSLGSQPDGSIDSTAQYAQLEAIARFIDSKLPKT